MRVVPSGLVLSMVAIVAAVGCAGMAGYRSVAGRAGAPAQEGRMQGRRAAVGREHSSLASGRCKSLLEEGRPGTPSWC